MNPLIDNALGYYDPAQAARALADKFAGCRLKIDGHLQSPVGATVSYDLKLDGFAGRWLKVWWSLEGGQRLSNCWWKEVSVEEVKPNVEHRTLTERFWVPMPRQGGEYSIHLVLTDLEGRRYQSATAEPVLH